MGLPPHLMHGGSAGLLWLWWAWNDNHMVWTVFPHLHHFLGTQRRPPALKLKLTILFKYTVINHVTGVSPSTISMLLAWQLGTPQGS